MKVSLYKWSDCRNVNMVLTDIHALKKLTKQPVFLFMTEWTEKNKLTLEDNTVSYHFTLFICGGPCHLSSFKLRSGDLVFLWEWLVYSSYGANKYFRDCLITFLILYIFISELEFLLQKQRTATLPYQWLAEMSLQTFYPATGLVLTEDASQHHMFFIVDIFVITFCSNILKCMLNFVQINSQSALLSYCTFWNWQANTEGHICARKRPLIPQY